MKIYRCSYCHPDLGRQLAWFSKKTEAKAFAKSIIQDQEDKEFLDLEIEQIEIPRSREGLIHWLNWNLRTDNG